MTLTQHAPGYMQDVHAIASIHMTAAWCRLHRVGIMGIRMLLPCHNIRYKYQVTEFGN